MESSTHSCLNTGSLGVAQLMFTQLITTLTNSYCDLNPAFPPDQSSQVLSGDEKFDFIVVGAGSAGSTIAARLSEVSHWKILLIEAGKDPPLESNIPALVATMFNTTYDWKFKVEPSKNACRSSKNKQCIWPKGRMLGGSSSMNGMFYIPGLAQDYDNWAKQGNAGWSYKDVLKYFKKLEQVGAKNSINEFHGYEGPVNVEEFSESKLQNFAQVEKLIKDATAELGLPEQPDFAASMKSGSIALWGTVKNGTRASTAKSYLVPARDRKNLIVMKEALVTKLLINQKLVYGVEVFKNGQLKNITCTKEVILSAGAINSPKIMMLSGLGPREHLHEHGIHTIANLKVGYNLQDHIMVANSYIKTNIQPPASGEHDAFYNYLTRRTELGTIQGMMIFVDTLNHSNDYPDLQFHIFNQILLPRLSFVDILGLDEKFMKWIDGMRKWKDVTAIWPTLLRPKSTGRVMLNSTNFLDPPKLISGYLKHEEDVKTLIRGIKFLAKKLMKTNALANASLIMGSAEECNHLKADSDQLYECYIRNFGVTVYHVAGSCKMGPKEDPLAVVDSRLKVYQMKGLRVADSSIMPHIVSGNTNVPTIMIGEKAADMIKEDWSEKDTSV